MEELALMVAFGLAPLGGFAVLLFIWNAWLAPGRLYREQANELDRLNAAIRSALEVIESGGDATKAARILREATDAT